MVRKSRRVLELLLLVSLVICGIPVALSHAASALPPADPGPFARPAFVVYSQPPNPNGGILLSSKRVPNGSDRDQYTWDGFRLGVAQSVTEVRWRGAYDPAWLGSGGKVFDFNVDIYASIPSGMQPDLAAGPLSHYQVGGNAGEALSEVVAGVQTYDYAFVLPTPFLAAAGTKYWIQIVAHQPGAPDWGLAAGTNGDGAYFRRIPGAGENYQLVPGDAAFSLLAQTLNARKLHLPIILRAGG